MSQTEEEMCCRQEKSYGGVSNADIHDLGNLNFSISVLPVV